MLREAEVKVELAKLLDEYGDDYVYEPPNNSKVCVYADKEGNPSCIVGHLLSRLEPEVFEYLRSTYNRISIIGVISRGIVDVENDLLYFRLWELQTQQDKKIPWGNAVESVFGNVEA